VAYVGSGWRPRLIIFTFSISFRFIAHGAASAKIRNYLDIRPKRLFKNTQKRTSWGGMGEVSANKEAFKGAKLKGRTGGKMAAPTRLPTRQLVDQ